eukprot:Seg4533.1 transcript_id=Seg4533.1/GoldUCD/mRNA.D3Y31 product="Threonine aspartase 1" protein_id=Seg4533.1/GoldUCD/D3Y31
MTTKESPSAGFVVVHLGAGYHSRSKIPKYKSLCRKACNLGIQLCQQGQAASRIACAVVSLLEDSDLTNAGFGSNLTNDGKVQCDASLMDSQHGNFAAVGCVEGIKNPIRVAYDLLENQEKDRDCGLEPPMILVGDGAKKWALERGINEVSNSEMVSDKSHETYRKAKRALENLHAETANDAQVKHKPHVIQSREMDHQDERPQGASFAPRNAKTKSKNFVTERIHRNAANHKQVKPKPQACEVIDLDCPDGCLQGSCLAPRNEKTRSKTLVVAENTDHRKLNVNPMDRKHDLTGCLQDGVDESYENVKGEAVKFGNDVKLQRADIVSQEAGMGSSYASREKAKRKANTDGRGCITVGKKGRTDFSSSNLMQGEICKGARNSMKHGNRTSSRESDFASKVPTEDSQILGAGDSVDDHLREQEERLDTVGAICLDIQGNVCSAVSSGGLILKHPGRIGQAACYGCGCFVAETDSGSGHEISACSTSGCGEQLIKTVLARQCAEELLINGMDIDLTGVKLLEDTFLKSRYLRNTEEKLAGCINVKVVRHNGNADVANSHSDIGGNDQSDTYVANSNAGENFSVKGETFNTNEEGNSAEASSDSKNATTSLDLIVTCTTKSFCVGFMSTQDSKAKFLLLEMPDGKKIGTSAVSQVFHYSW